MREGGGGQGSELLKVFAQATDGWFLYTWCLLESAAQEIV